jgi:hypothetical protein
VKGRWTCPGYPDDIDIRFRYITQDMILRSRSRPSEDRQREKGAVGSAQQIDIDSNVSLTAIAGLGIQRRCVVPSIVEQATAFFFYRYVWGARKPVGKTS